MISDGSWKPQNIEEGNLTLFIMCELIINLKLATAGSRYFELQKYPPKENCMMKLAASPGIWTWDQYDYNLQYTGSTLDQGNKTW